MTSDHFPSRDSRVRLIGDSQSFERMEPMLRRSLLMVGLLALGIGIGHHWSQYQSAPTADAVRAAQALRTAQLLTPGP